MIDRLGCDFTVHLAVDIWSYNELWTLALAILQSDVAYIQELLEILKNSQWGIPPVALTSNYEDSFDLSALTSYSYC